MGWVAAGLVVAAFNFLVIEYETDVPQFSAVWYLPALALVSALAFGLVRLATEDRWSATRAALVQLGFVAVVSLFLLIEGFDAPRLPLLVLPAAALDTLAARRAPLAAQAAGYVLVLFAVNGFAVDVLDTPLTVDAAQLLIGLPLAYGAVLGALALTSGAMKRVRRPAVAAGLMTLAL